MSKMKKLLTSILFLSIALHIHAQENIIDLSNDSTRMEYRKAMRSHDIFKPRHFDISESEAIKLADRLPAFAVYRDTYFVTGIPLNKEITNNSADASFQISVRQRLTKSVLPFNTFAYMTYTQR